MIHYANVTNIYLNMHAHSAHFHFSCANMNSMKIRTDSSHSAHWASAEKISCIAAMAVMIAMTAALSFVIVLKGPSGKARDLAVSTLMETRRGKAIARFFFSGEELAAMMSRNTIAVTGMVSAGMDTDYDIPAAEKDRIQIVDVKGALYQGKLMIVRDPSRISLGVNLQMSDVQPPVGYYVEDYINHAGGIAGINAGGFDDPGGVGDGSVPFGLVIQNGVIISGSADCWSTVIGFNEHHHLMVGNMTGEQALSYGLWDAISFGPALIINYVPVPTTGSGGGLNPRTVIGQREDGAVLLLVIEGRQTSSLGATYQDCIDIMMQHGAINAANLDGGGCSTMVYQGETLTSSVSVLGKDRKVPTAWIVK